MARSPEAKKYVPYRRMLFNMSGHITIRQWSSGTPVQSFLSSRVHFQMARRQARVSLLSLSGSPTQLKGLTSGRQKSPLFSLFFSFSFHLHHLRNQNSNNSLFKLFFFIFVFIEKNDRYDKRTTGWFIRLGFVSWWRHAPECWKNQAAGARER